MPPRPAGRTARSLQLGQFREPSDTSSSKLPPSVANLKILDSEQIKFVEDSGKALKGLALLTIIVQQLYALTTGATFSTARCGN